MGLQSKLSHWIEGGIISVDQAQSIRNFERQKLSEKLQNGLKYSGFFAILLGIALIIASNWDAFGIYFKLGAHIAINTVLAGLIWVWRKNPKRMLWREFAVYFLFGLTLTLLALIGQSFQLQGDMGGLLLLWMGLTTGFIAIVGQNKRIVSFWFNGFFVTLFYNIEKIADIKPEYLAFFTLVSMSLFIPLGGYLLGSLKKSKNLNPAFFGSLQNVCITSAIIIAGFSSLFFYERIIEVSIVKYMGLDRYYLWIGAVSIVYITAIIGPVTARKNDESLMAVILSGIFTLIPLILLLNIDILSAIHFIAFMAGLSFMAARSGHETVLGLCMFAISIRIFIIFIELFGSMFATGGGLIFAGILLLAILKATNILRKKIIEETHAS